MVWLGFLADILVESGLGGGAVEEDKITFISSPVYDFARCSYVLAGLTRTPICDNPCITKEFMLPHPPFPLHGYESTATLYWRWTYIFTLTGLVTYYLHIAPLDTGLCRGIFRGN